MHDQEIRIVKTQHCHQQVRSADGRRQVNCPRPAVDDGYYCQGHLEAHRATQKIQDDEREQKQRIRALADKLDVDVRPEALRGHPPRTITPGKAVIDLAMLEALLRIATDQAAARP